MTSDNCGKCEKPANLQCTNCKNIFYCSRECQKKDWKSHKNQCKTYEIEIDEKMGRVLKATRDLKEGTVLFTETPAVLGPKWILDEEEENDETFLKFSCVGCFDTIKHLRHKCSICLWPACSPDCIGLTNSELHGIECSFLKLGRGPQNKLDVKSIKNYYRSEILLVLKILILQRKDPKKFKMIMEMESNETKRSLTDNYKEAEERILMIEENFLKPMKSAEEKNGQIILPLKDKKFLHKIYGILESNAMYISLNHETEICGLFITAALFEHSCLPNIAYNFDMKNGFRATIKAGRDIKKGENLAISYSNVLWPTSVRQQQLRDNKYFMCTCDRCKDPTELNTNFSTLRCIGTEINPCNGTQLPTKPLSDTENEYACNKCPIKVSMNHVNMITTRMNEEVDNILAMDPNPDVLEDLIEKLSPFLHQNHYLLFNLKHTLIQLYGKHPRYLYPSISDDVLKRKLTMCNDLQQIVLAFDPYGIRIAFYICIVFYEKAQCLIEMVKRKMEGAELVEAKKCLEKAKRIVRSETDSREGELFLQKIENVLFKL